MFNPTPNNVAEVKRTLRAVCSYPGPFYSTAPAMVEILVSLGWATQCWDDPHKFFLTRCGGDVLRSMGRDAR